jgi:hypothetical protein
MALFFATGVGPFEDQLNYAIQFFGAATPFLTSLALLVALLIILLRYRADKREQAGAPQSEQERRDRIMEMIEILKKTIL